MIKVSKVDEVKGSIGQSVNDSKGQLGSEPEDQRIRGSEGQKVIGLESLSVKDQWAIMIIIKIMTKIDGSKDY